MNMENVNDVFASAGGIMVREEVPSRSEYDKLRRAVDRGEIVRLKQGVYADPSAILNNMIDVEKIVPEGVVCLYNAWAFYSLATIVPPAFCIAIEAKRKVKTPTIIPVQLYYWKKEYLTLGVTEVEISGYRVKITDVERSVCDAIKYRNKIGLDVCAEVIRNYLKSENRNISKLMEYAQTLRVAKVLNNYLEIALV